jgi:hypothetical protein
MRRDIPDGQDDARFDPLQTPPDATPIFPAYW